MCKPRQTRISEHTPLPKGEMDVLWCLYLENRPMSTQEIAHYAEVRFESSYMLMGRLKRRKLVKSSMRLLPGEEDRLYRFALYNLTADGRRLISRWGIFMESIGPKLRKLAGW